MPAGASSPAVNTITAYGTPPYGTTEVSDTDTESVNLGTPSLSITKTAIPSAGFPFPVRNGESFTYSVTVTNQSSVWQNGVTVSDPLPAGLGTDGGVTVSKTGYSVSASDGFGTGTVGKTTSYTLGSGWAGNWDETVGDTNSDPTGGKIKVATVGNPANSLAFTPDKHRYTIKRGVTLTGATSGTLSFDCRAGAALEYDTDAVKNDALDVLVNGSSVFTINSTNYSTLCSTATSPWSLPVSITLTAAQLGSTVDPNTISFSATGDVDLWIDNVTLSATVPAVNGVSAGAPPTLTTAPTSAGFYNLAPGQSATFTIPVKVTLPTDGPLPTGFDGFQFSNLASATSTLQTSPVTAAVSTPYIKPDFKITKTAIETWVNDSDPTTRDVTYRIELRNEGTSVLSNPEVSDPLCDAAPVLVSGDLNSDKKLLVGEVWRYECTNTVTTPANATNPDAPDDVPNIAKAQFTDASGVTLAWKEAPANVKVIHPSIDLVVSPTTKVILTGGTVSYTYTLENTGDVAITNPTVTAANCPSVSYSSGDLNNDGDLDITETWTFTCTTAALTADVTDAQVTASGNDLIFGWEVTDTHTVSVDVINPIIAVDKKVYDATTMQPSAAVDALTPESALEVGTNNDVVYLYAVTNPGDTPLAVTLFDDHTPTPPVFVSGDTDSDRLLDPGETWLYTFDANQVDGGYSGTITGIVSAVGTYDVGTSPENLTGTVSATDVTNVRVFRPELVLLKNTDATTVKVGTAVTYRYTVLNSGQTSFALTGLGAATDDKCSPLERSAFAGTALDADGDGLLDPGEEVHYTCTSTLAPLGDGTTTYEHRNTFELGQSTDTRGGTYKPMDATVGVYVINPDFTLAKLAATGGNSGTDIIGEAGDPVTYTFTIAHKLTATGTNLDSLNALSLDISDPTCSPDTLAYVSGDNGDGRLNPGETLVYTCTLNSLPDGDPTVNTVNVVGTVVARPLDGEGHPVIPTDGLDPITKDASATVTPRPITVTVLKKALHCDTDQPVCSLPGAQFSLYTADPTGSTPGAGVVLTPAAEDGSKFTASLVVNRTYWLVETKAPEDFQLLAQPIKFTLTRTNPTDAAVLTLDAASASGLITVDSTTYTLTIVDVPAAELPKAGGEGTLPYLAIGLLLVAGAAGYYRATSRPPSAPRRAM